MGIKRSELIRLYNIFSLRLSANDIALLKTNRLVWKDVDFNNRPLVGGESYLPPYVRLNDGGRDFLWNNQICFRIQDMLDAVSNKTWTTYTIGLTRDQLGCIALELKITADKLEPPATKPLNKRQILDAILGVCE